MEPTPEQTAKSRPAQGELVAIVALVVFLVCMAAGAIFWLGGAYSNGWPAAIAVTGLSIMGLGVSYLVLRRR